MRITTAEQLLDALIVEEAAINKNKTTLGLSNQDETECQEDRANLQTALDNVPVATAVKESATAVKNAVFNGNSKETIQPYASFNLTVLPFPAANAGALTRYNSRRRRAMASANYTEQIGEEMGYANPQTDAPAPSSVKPSLQAFAAAIGYMLSAVVGSRAESNMWELQMRRKGEETWSVIKTATGKSADATVTPTTPGQPEQIELRVILYKNNQIYGQPSDSVYVTLNP